MEINEEPFCNKDFLASVCSCVLRLIAFWSGQIAFACSITNFSFVFCIVFLSWLWFLHFESWKCLFCQWWLMLEKMSAWYFEFCVWTIEMDRLLFLFLILSQISINESFGTLSFKAWKYSFLTILRSSILLLTAAIILPCSLKEALHRIFWLDFCRSSEF